MNTTVMGVIGTSKKEDERRYPIHPEHLSRIPARLRRQLIFEKGYGIPFGIADAEIAALTGGIAPRHELLADIGMVIINKPVLADLIQLRQGGTLWGYVHCVQQRDITQAAIDRNQTLIAFEDMFIWSPNGHIGRHTFYKNNEMAGYCAVIHALQLKGIDGHYGNQRKTIIFGFGAVSRGAIYALKAMVLEILPSAFSALTTRYVKRCLIVIMLEFAAATQARHAWYWLNTMALPPH